MLQALMQKLNIPRQQTEIYSLLLEEGGSTVGQLAKRLNIPRASLYDLVKKMIERGLLVESQKDSVKFYTSVNPEKLVSLFEQEIQGLEKSKNDLEKLVPNLLQNFSSHTTPRIQVYEGVEGVKQILRDMVLYKDIETFAFWPIKEMIEVLTPEFFEYLNRQRVQRNIYTKALWPQAQTVDLKNHPFLGVGETFQREIRVMPKGLEFELGYWAYNDKVAFVSSKDEAFGFIIQSKALVQMLKTQFDFIWKQSKAIPDKPEYTKTFLEHI